MNKIWAVRITMVAVIVIAAVFVPFGYAITAPIAWGKVTGEVCSEPGCWNPATKTIEYDGGTLIHFCSTHALSAPNNIWNGSNNVILIGALFSICLYIFVLLLMFDEGKPARSDVFSKPKGGLEEIYAIFSFRAKLILYPIFSLIPMLFLWIIVLYF